MSGTVLKTIINRCAIILSLSVLMVASRPVFATEPQSLLAELQRLAESPARSANSKHRNIYRNPAETLEFMGIRPDMAVLEIWPARGWYTEILAPFLKDQGHLAIAQFRHNDGTLRNERDIFWARISSALSARIMAEPEYFGDVELLELDPPNLLPALPVERFDMVLTFRNAHIWNERGELLATLKTLYSTLKPGGILGMKEHRAARLTDISSLAVEGYLDESYVIAAAQMAGFELVATSEINANPADTKDYSKGVYALPPTLAQGLYNRAHYVAIGESDRMTLKFIKPAG